MVKSCFLHLLNLFLILTLCKFTKMNSQPELPDDGNQIKAQLIRQIHQSKIQEPITPEQNFSIQPYQNYWNSMDSPMFPDLSEGKEQIFDDSNSHQNLFRLNMNQESIITPLGMLIQPQNLIQMEPYSTIKSRKQSKWPNNRYSKITFKIDPVTFLPLSQPKKQQKSEGVITIKAPKIPRPPLTKKQYRFLNKQFSRCLSQLKNLWEGEQQISQIIKAYLKIEDKSHETLRIFFHQEESTDPSGLNQQGQQEDHKKNTKIQHKNLIKIVKNIVDKLGNDEFYDKMKSLATNMAEHMFDNYAEYCQGVYWYQTLFLLQFINKELRPMNFSKKSRSWAHPVIHTKNCLCDQIDAKQNKMRDL